MIFQIINHMVNQKERKDKNEFVSVRFNDYRNNKEWSRVHVEWKW